MKLDEDKVNTKGGGLYVNPFKLAQQLAEIDDKTSEQYQRMTWDALRKSINGLVNKVNITNIKAMLPEIFGEVCALTLLLPLYRVSCHVRFHIASCLLRVASCCSLGKLWHLGCNVFCIVVHIIQVYGYV